MFLEIDRIKLYKLIFLFILVSSNISNTIVSDDFISIKNQIDGELHLLRKKFESPQLQHSIYDIHFREYIYSINNSRVELSWEENLYNSKKNILNWSLLIPIKEQSYLHFIEAKTLWEKKQIIPAIFLWKSLLKNDSSNIAKDSHIELQKLLKNQRNKEIFDKIDPYFLYNLSSNKTTMFSDLWGISLEFNDYWYFDLKNSQWFYFNEIEPKKRIFILNNNQKILYFYLQKTKENQLKSYNDIIQWVDWIFSWNENIKNHYDFKRESIIFEDNIYMVSYKKNKEFYQYYEKFFLFSYGFCYIRIYNVDNLDFIKNILLK
jgi:hypothetical protein